VAQSIGEAVFDLTLNDKAFQAGLARANNSTKSFADSTGRLRDEFGRFVPKANQAGEGLERFAGAAGKQGVYGGLLTQLGGIGLQLGAIGVAAAAFDQFKKADDANAALKTLGVNTTQLGSNLRLVSAELKGSASTLELTKGAYDVASAGFSNAADATQILKASAMGAKGGFSDLNTVADAATSVLNAYGLKADQVSKIVDGFITTQNDGKIVVDQYAQQIGKVAPIAAAAGISIEELNAAISAATAQGVPVESTFAGLRQVISSIVKPTKEASDTAASLGLNFSASALKAKGLGGFLQEVAAKTKGSVEANSLLFGSVEALTAIQPLLNDQLANYNKFLANQQNNAGAAASASGIATSTISQGITAIGNALSNLVTSKSLGSLGASFVGIADAINSISLSPAEKELTGIEAIISRSKAQIENDKKYNLDTTSAEKKLSELEKRANAARNVIQDEQSISSVRNEIVDITKQISQAKEYGQETALAEGKLKGLIARLKELSGTKAPSFGVQDFGLDIKAWMELNGQIMKSGDVLRNSAGKEATAAINALVLRLGDLSGKAINLKVGVEKDKVDAEIEDVKQQIANKKAELNLKLDQVGLDAEIKDVQNRLKSGQVDSGIGKLELARLQAAKNELSATSAQQKASNAEQQVASTQQQAAANTKVATVQTESQLQELLNTKKKQEAEALKTTGQLLDEKLGKEEKSKELLAFAAQQQTTISGGLSNAAANTTAAAEGAKKLTENLQGAAQAKGSLATDFQAQVKVVLDGTQIFQSMSGYLKTIAENSSKPVVVTVNSSGGSSGSRSSNAALRAG
jgi:TP901 family phage tail tape measure protein